MDYPSWRSPECRSTGGFLCDPGQTPYMSDAERVNLTRSSWTWRERNLVECGRLLNDPVDSRHLQPFFLGIAVLPEWPSSMSDPASLEHMGQIVDADWNMDQRYIGAPVPRLRCPTSAMLFLLPESGQAFLSSGSCEFICASRGGEDVVRRARAALRSDPASGSKVYAAALAGAEAAYAFVGSSRPLGEAPTAEPARPAQPIYISEALQRSLFALAVCALVGSLVLGLAVLFVVPYSRSKHGSAL